MNKVIILNSQNGDWEGLFVNGELVDEGHVLGEGYNKQYMMELPEKYKVKASDIKFKEVNDEDENYLYDYGSFPKTLKELKGNYNE